MPCFHQSKKILMGIEAENIVDVDEDGFDTLVIEASSNQPVMVDFWAEWCPPCRALTPVLEKIATRHPDKILLAKVEVDDNMRLAGRYGLRGFPTVIVFIDGEECGRFSGFKPEAEVIDFLTDNQALT